MHQTGHPTKPPTPTSNLYRPIVSRMLTHSSQPLQQAARNTTPLATSNMVSLTVKKTTVTHTAAAENLQVKRCESEVKVAAESCKNKATSNASLNPQNRSSHKTLSKQSSNNMTSTLSRRAGGGAVGALKMGTINNIRRNSGGGRRPSVSVKTGQNLLGTKPPKTVQQTAEAKASLSKAKSEQPEEKVQLLSKTTNKVVQHGSTDDRSYITTDLKFNSPTIVTTKGYSIKTTGAKRVTDH